MFNRKKYNSRSRERKSFHRRCRRKTAILKPAFPKVPNPQPTFDASGSSTYPWRSVLPTPQDDPVNSTGVSKSSKPPGGNEHTNLKTLKALCSETAAKNADCISSFILKQSSWSCWKLVWQAILEAGNDSPEVFREFAIAFGENKSFMCHWIKDYGIVRHPSSIEQARNSTLNACLIPFYNKHRIENVFANIPMQDFLDFVHGLPSASVTIDCSKMPSFTTTTILSLCNISSLECLDLSGNNQIDDQFLYTLRMRLNSRQSRLKVIKLSCCPNVTENGLYGFLRNVASSQLFCVESDISLLAKSRFNLNYSDYTSIYDTFWKVATRVNKVSDVYKYQLAFKLHILMRELDTCYKPKIMWDFKFFPQNIELLSNIESLYFDSWNVRKLHTTNQPLDPPFIYIKDLTMKEQHGVKSADIPRNIRNDADINISFKQKLRKPKKIRTNVGNFFFEQ